MNEMLAVFLLILALVAGAGWWFFSYAADLEDDPEDVWLPESDPRRVWRRIP